jgi:hypothetical protein
VAGHDEPGWVVIGCISATFLTGAAASIAGGDTFTYTLNNTLAEANGGPSLVSYGGTLGSTGYTFGAQPGLSLSGTGPFEGYSIDIRFYFDDVNASFNGFQKILDFKDRMSDSGLYSGSGSLQLFATTGSGDPHAGSGVHDFTNGTIADLRVTDDPQHRDLLLKLASQWREDAQALRRGAESTQPPPARRNKR